MIQMNDFRAEPEELLKAQAAAAERVIRSGWYVLGNEVKAFEAAWAAPKEEQNHVHHLFVVTCGERDAFMAHLKGRGVEAQIHYSIPSITRNRAGASRAIPRDWPAPRRMRAPASPSPAIRKWATGKSTR